MIQKISDITKGKIAAKSADILPNSPTKAGWSAQSIRNALHKPITDETNSVVSEINRIASEEDALFRLLLLDADLMVSTYNEDGKTKVLGLSGNTYEWETNKFVCTKIKTESEFGYVPGNLIITGYDGNGHSSGILNVSKVHFKNDGYTDANANIKYLHLSKRIATFMLDVATLLPSVTDIFAYNDLSEIFSPSNAVPVGVVINCPDHLTTAVQDVVLNKGWTATVKGLPSLESIRNDAYEYTDNAAVSTMGAVVEMIVGYLTGGTIDQDMKPVITDFMNSLSPSYFYQIAQRFYTDEADVADKWDALIGTTGTYDNPEAGTIVYKLKAFTTQVETALNALKTALAGSDMDVTDPDEGSVLDELNDADTQNASGIAEIRNRLYGNGSWGTPENNTWLDRVSDNEVAIHALQASALGYTHNYYCLNFSAFAAFLAGGNGVYDANGHAVQPADLRTGDMVYLKEETVPDFWFNADSSAASTYADTFTYEGTTYQLFIENVGYFNKVEIDDSALSGYVMDAEAWARGTRGGQNVSPSDITYQDNSKWWCQQAELHEGNAQDARDDAEDARDIAVGAKNDAEYAMHQAQAAVQNGAYITFETDTETGECFVVKTNTEDFDFEVDNSDGGLYIVLD